MSGRTVAHYEITCDGCGTTIGNAAEYPTATAGRAAATEQGWTIVPKLRRNGEPAKIDGRRGRYSDDICPACLPDWQPGPIPQAPRQSWLDDPDALRARAERIERDKAAIKRAPSQRYNCAAVLDAIAEYRPCAQPGVRH